MGAFFSGCATLDPIDKVPADKKVALVSAINPVMHGQKLGITIFENKEWTEENPDFDVNAVVLNAIKTNLNRDVKLVNGGDVGLLLKNKLDDSLFFDSSPTELTQKLTALGREWQVDLILLVQSTKSRDWIYQTTASIEGFGHFSRFGFGRNLAYGVFRIRVFDCKTGEFAGGDEVRQSQLLPGVEWHGSWKEYTPEEQRVVTRGLEAVIKTSAPAMLTGAGLTDAKAAEPSLGSMLLDPNGVRPRSYVPEGNEIEIPSGVSKPAARAAVVDGLKDREWVLTINTAYRMVGVYRDGKKEAMCTFTFTDHSIIMAPEGHEIKEDGQRVPVEYYHRWHNNLKESIVEALMKTPASTAP